MRYYRWTQTHNLMLNIVFKQSYLTQIVSESNIHFRSATLIAWSSVADELTYSPCN